LHPERGVSEFEATLRELLSAGHAARFCASGDSMYPAICSGDYLRIVPCQTSELRRGHVILAATERGLTAHRIVRISERDGSLRITTRGDNALRSDRPLDASDILGRVEQIDRNKNVSTSIAESVTIIRFATVVVRRLRARFQH
jgi:signal peptidase I